MDALDETLEKTAPFPGGLFWLNRGEKAPLPRVSDFLIKAAAKGVDGGLVVIDNFDETMRDLVRLLSDLDTATLDAFSAQRTIWSPPAKLTGGRGFPVVRLNALEVTTTPTVRRGT